jgi:hypothetical protein
LFRYWLLRYLSELSKRQRIDGNYLPPFAAKLKNKGQLLRKGWGTRWTQSFLSGHRELQKTECHIEGAQHEHTRNQYRHSTGEQRVSLEGGGYVVGRYKSGERQHQAENG